MYISQWFYMRKQEKMAYHRLGKKISYLSLYEYCYIVDKHEKEVAELKQTINQLKNQYRTPDQTRTLEDIPPAIRHLSFKPHIHRTTVTENKTGTMVEQPKRLKLEFELLES